MTTPEEEFAKKRLELLQLSGTGRNILEMRIVALVRVLDAAHELKVADAAAQAGEPDADVRYENAWDALRSTLRNFTPP